MYGNFDLQQTAEDIRILKRHVDELNELFVSGQAAEDAGWRVDVLKPKETISFGKKKEEQEK